MQQSVAEELGDTTPKSMYSVLGVNGFTFLPPSTVGHYSQTAQFLFHLTTELSSRSFSLCSCDQQQTLIEHVASKKTAFFLENSLYAHFIAMHTGMWITPKSTSL